MVFSRATSNDGSRLGFEGHDSAEHNMRSSPLAAGRPSAPIPSITKVEEPDADDTVPLLLMPDFSCRTVAEEEVLGYECSYLYPPEMRYSGFCSISDMPKND